MYDDPISGVTPLSVQHDELEYRQMQDPPKREPRAGASTWPRHMGFGEHYDYEVLDHGEHIVIFPVCDAALQYLYYILPESTPRWGVNEFAMNGFKLEREQARRVMDAMYKLSLFSDEDKAREEEQNRRQWE